jgi:hypothetical protein
MNALQKLLNYVDPQADEPYTSLTPADASEVLASTETGCWETWTGTHYPTHDSVPWQSRGSAVRVQCDGTGEAHS